MAGHGLPRGWRPLLLLLLSLANALPASPTNSTWIAQVWQSDDGLPNNNVTGLAQTSDGYLWVANYSRLARFDGVQFEDYASRVVVPGRDERISTLLRSTKGGLWMAMDHGPVVYLDSSHTKIFTNRLPDLIAQQLAEDNEGALWVKYRGGVICRIRGGQTMLFGPEDGLPNGTVSSIAGDVRGQVWFARAGQIGVYRGGKFVSLTNTGDTSAIYLAPARRGGVWICQGTALYHYDETTRLKECGRFKAENIGVGLEVLLEDRSGAVWIGTFDSGLFRFDGSGFESVPVSHREILSLAEDREGNIWVGTGGGGLNEVQHRAVMLETPETGLPFETLQSVCENIDGSLWAVTQNGLLARRTADGWQTISTNADWPGGKPACVAADGQGTLWIGTDSGMIHRWQNGTYRTWRLTDGLAVRHARSLLVNREGDVWIAGSSPDALQRFHAGQFHTYTLAPDLGILRAMTEDTRGNIWVASSKRALLRLNGDTITDESRIQPYPMSIRTLAATPDGSVWIGYAGSGLARYKDGRYARITSAEGLYDDFISEIVPDDRGWLWLGADHGVFRIQQQEFQKVTLGVDTHLRSIHYGHSAGLPSLQANFGYSPAAARTRDGLIWMPMRSSLAVANPELAGENTNAPPVLLRDVKLDDQVVAAYGGVMRVAQGIDLRRGGSPLQLDPDHRHLQFHFTALTFNAPENVRFRYRLEGFDEPWIEAGTDREANYSRLPAGNYVFRVMACNSDGLWSEPGASLAFTVTPFVWQTWWFRLSVIAVFTVIVGGIARFVSVRRVHLKMEKLEQETAMENSRIAGMAEVATSVLHNVGNVVNSVNVSNSVIRDKIRGSKISFLNKIVELLEQHAHDLPSFFANDPKGQQLPKYLSDLAKHLAGEQQEILQELTGLGNNIEHIKDIVARQQSYARVSGVTESVNVAELVEDAIQINVATMVRNQVDIVREFDQVPPITTDKHKVLQILINLVSNAKYALLNAEGAEKKLTVQVAMHGDNRVKIVVADNGVGIPAENLPRIFQHGFTTKKTGHGFGLHSSALTANELGGSLTVHSDGPGKGAVFTLEFPSSQKN